MWIPFYHGDLWRMYFYVPLGASAAVLGAAAHPDEIIAPYAAPPGSCAGDLPCVLMLPATSRLFGQHQRYVQSANNKARILYSVMERAPAVAPRAQMLITTDMGLPELNEARVFLNSCIRRW